MNVQTTNLCYLATIAIFVTSQVLAETAPAPAQGPGPLAKRIPCDAFTKQADGHGGRPGMSTSSYRTAMSSQSARRLVHAGNFDPWLRSWGCLGSGMPLRLRGSATRN